MSELNPGNPSRPEEDEGISYVEREMRRRKRLLRFYLALLMIPILLGVAVLLFGRSDRQLVTEELESQAPAVLRQTVGNQFAPAIQAEVQNQISPTLGRINELKTRQDSIADEVKTLSASTAKLTPEDVEIVRQTGQRLARQETAISDLQNATRQSGERLARQDAVIGEIQKQTESIRGQFREMNLSDIRRKLGVLEAQIKDLSGKLDGRVRGNQGKP